MKLISVILFISLQNINTVKAQDDEHDLLKTYKVDFAVPDLPAFKILGNSPSTILRPSTPEALAIIVSQFLSGYGLIPNSFSAEMAPYILFNYNKMTLQDYDRNQILYSLRISIGTLTEEDRTTNLPAEQTSFSLGGRITLIDEGDLKNDKVYRKELFILTGEMIDLDSLFQFRFLEETGYLIHEVAADPIKKEEMDNYIKENVSEYEEFIGLTFDERLSLIKQEYKAKNWNKRKWDLAAASLGMSDTLTNKIKFVKHSLWTTYTMPLSHWGQLLFGGNFNFISEMNNYISFSIASRLYGGINRIKGFIETQYGYNELLSSGNFLLILGSEINLYDGIWTSFYAGVEYLNLGNNGSSQFVTHFDLRFTIPEGFNLF